MEKYYIPRGVFSRKFTLKNNDRRCVVYDTPRQSIALLENDSADVYQIIFENNGDIGRAYNHILNRIEGEGKEEAAKNILSSFIENLKALNLLNDSNSSSDIKSLSEIKIPSAIKKGVSPLLNTELAVAQIMADNHIFYALTIELTYRCNEKCVHCYCPADRDIGEMDLETITELIRQFKNLNGFKIHLTGGEIFIRKDIKEILRLFKNQNIIPDITSNLTLIDDEGFDILADLHPRAVGCSIYSALPEMHDRVTGLKGSFERSIRAIKKLKSMGVPVVIKAPLMNITASGWAGIEALAGEIGCEYQFDLNITAKNDGGKSPLNVRLMDVELIKKIMSSNFYRLYCKDEPMRKHDSMSQDAILCGAGGTGLTISPDGSIRPCIGLSAKLGVFPNNSLEDIWNNSCFFKEWSSKKLKDIHKCADCKTLAYCNRCPGAWEAESGRYDIPSEYTCFLANIWSQVA